MGRAPQFPLSYAEVKEQIELYKADLTNGIIDRADFWDFCGRLGVPDDELINVMENPCDKNIELAQLLKKYVTWQKGQYLAGKGWGGPNSSKAIFALKQKMGGYQFTDKQEVQQNADVKINVRFGKVKDAFG